ncbi:hypothetical protein ACLKA7_012849 [Drosophila subpalustris]
MSWSSVLGPGQGALFNSCARFPLGLIAGSAAALMLLPISDADAGADDSRPAWNVGLFDIYKFWEGGRKMKNDNTGRVESSRVTTTTTTTLSTTARIFRSREME